MNRRDETGEVINASEKRGLVLWAVAVVTFLVISCGCGLLLIAPDAMSALNPFNW